MYILPTPTHLEVVALGGSSDIFFFRHFNYELNQSSTLSNKRHAGGKCGKPGNYGNWPPGGKAGISGKRPAGGNGNGAPGQAPSQAAKFWF